MTSFQKNHFIRDFVFVAIETTRLLDTQTLIISEEVT